MDKKLNTIWRLKASYLIYFKTAHRKYNLFGYKKQIYLMILT